MRRREVAQPHHLLELRAVDPEDARTRVGGEVHVRVVLERRAEATEAANGRAEALPVETRPRVRVACDRRVGAQLDDQHRAIQSAQCNQVGRALKYVRVHIDVRVAAARAPRGDQAAARVVGVLLQILLTRGAREFVPAKLRRQGSDVEPEGRDVEGQGRHSKVQATT